MEYQDRIYGHTAIVEPVLLDILQSSPMQRLRGILQHGITGLIGICSQTSRLEHSIGTMLLVKQLDGSLEEQIAALLHDVSHTVFSHVIDHVYNRPHTQCFHETVKKRYIAESELPGILKAHGYDWLDFVDEAPYTLLEQPAPALCADRVDYLCRDCVDLNLLGRDDLEFILGSLEAADGLTVCRDVNAAEKMADCYMAADHASWSNFREVGLYEVTARVIRRGLRTKVISKAELWSSDKTVWEKLKNSDDRKMRHMIRFVSPKTRFVWDAENPTFRIVSKIRTIDPHIKTASGIAKLSDLNASFRRKRIDYLKRKERELPIRVVGY